MLGNIVVDKDIKTKKDLESCLGKKITEQILSKKRHGMKRVPSWVHFRKYKPQFCLDNGDLLYAYAFDAYGELVGEKYCGSGDSVIHHQFEQLAEGQEAPENSIIIFVTIFASSRNSPWSLDVVTDLVTGQLSE